MKLIFFILFSSLTFSSSARIMTYNILNYQDDNQREADYIDILTEIEPNILIIQEILGNEGFLNFKEDVLDILNPNQWSSANFTNQSAQQDIALYYYHDMFTLLESNVVETAQSTLVEDSDEEGEESGQCNIDCIRRLLNCLSTMPYNPIRTTPNLVLDSESLKVKTALTVCDFWFINIC